MGTLLPSVQLRHTLLHARLHLQVGLEAVSTQPVEALALVVRPICESHISFASVRSLDHIVFTIHPDDHEAKPGRAAGLTKPRQPAAGSRRAGVPQSAERASFGGG